MRRLAGLAGIQLKWEQPAAMKRGYNLYAGDEIAASLRFENPFSNFAVAESADGAWTFQRVGFFQQRTVVRLPDSTADIAAFQNNFWRSSGTLELPDGRQFTASANFWMTEYRFETEAGDGVFEYTRIGGLLHASAYVDIFPPAAQIPELPWMVMLGWYLVIMHQQDAAAAAV